MRVVNLKNPFLNGFGPNDREQAEAVLGEFQAVYDAIQAGKACVRYLDGDRKGSIARLSFDENYKSTRPEIQHAAYRSRWDQTITHKIEYTHFFCIATWDGRRNKVKVTIPNHYEASEILLDYDGPTVWEKFDAKSAKAALLKNPDQKDINGKVLSIGDRVLYINARYGSRMTLEEGIVQEFVASVNSKTHSFSTIIESHSGEQSSLQYPESMVYKL